MAVLMQPLHLVAALAAAGAAAGTGAADPGAPPRLLDATKALLAHPAVERTLRRLTTHWDTLLHQDSLGLPVDGEEAAAMYDAVAKVAKATPNCELLVRLEGKLRSVRYAWARETERKWPLETHRGIWIGMLSEWSQPRWRCCGCRDATSQFCCCAPGE